MLMTYSGMMICLNTDFTLLHPHSTYQAGDHRLELSFDAFTSPLHHQYKSSLQLLAVQSPIIVTIDQLACENDSHH
eukprot:m.65979 g.65979  ORF g.65979 m.65979 type:complete len:76 (-) comp14029_c0_seq1:2363-2590(-)